MYAFWQLRLIITKTNAFVLIVAYDSLMGELNKSAYTLGKKGCYTPGWCVFFVIISISSVREV